MNKQIIRAASPDDALHIIELIKAHALYEGHTLIIEQQLKALENLTELPILLYVVENTHSGELVGYMSLVKQFSTWDMSWYMYLDCLYLNESSRGNGLGKTMMNFAQEKSRELGISLMQWQTPKDNKSAINFYHALGAESLSKLRFFWPTEN